MIEEGSASVGALPALISNSLEDFFTMNRNLFRGTDANPDLIAFDIDHRHRHVLANLKMLTRPVTLIPGLVPLRASEM